MQTSSAADDEASAADQVKDLEIPGTCSRPGQAVTVMSRCPAGGWEREDDGTKQ